MTRLSALITHNGVGTSLREMTRLLAVVAHRLVLALARNVSGLLAAAADHLVRAIVGDVSGLEAAEADVAERESSARLAPRSEGRARSPLGTVASNVSGLLANAANHLALFGSGSGLSGLSGLFTEGERNGEHLRSSGLLCGLLSLLSSVRAVAGNVTLLMANAAGLGTTVRSALGHKSRSTIESVGQGSITLPHPQGQQASQGSHALGGRASCR